MKYVINIPRIWQQPLPVRIVGSVAAMSRNTAILVEALRKIIVANMLKFMAREIISHTS